MPILLDLLEGPQLDYLSFMNFRYLQFLTRQKISKMIVFFWYMEQGMVSWICSSVWVLDYVNMTMDWDLSSRMIQYTLRVQLCINLVLKLWQLFFLQFDNKLHFTIKWIPQWTPNPKTKVFWHKNRLKNQSKNSQNHKEPKLIFVKWKNVLIITIVFLQIMYIFRTLLS